MLLRLGLPGSASVVEPAARRSVTAVRSSRGDPLWSTRASVRPPVERLNGAGAGGRTEDGVAVGTA